MEWARFVELAGRETEIRVVLGEGTEEVRTPIWIVTAGGVPYVRSYRAAEGRWFRRVAAAGAARLEIGGEDVDVSVRAVEDPATLADTSAAYRSKYAGEAETEEMLAPAVAATTLQLLPAAG